MGKVIYRFFWWFAGANRKVLEQNEIDHNKYFQIGVSVFTTAVMATFTSLIAFHYAFNRGFEGEITKYTVVASIFWGLLILNLDRFLVLSMVKQGNSLLNPTPLEKFQNFMGEFAFAVPRILLAILIASVIVEPLELYLFKDQISNEQKILENKERAKYRTIKEEKSTQLKKAYESDIQRVKDKYALLIEQSKNIIKKNQKDIASSKVGDDIALNLLKQRLDEETSSYHLYEEQAKLEGSSARGGCGPKCREAQTAQRESFSKIMGIKAEIEARKLFLDEGIVEKSNEAMKQQASIASLEEKNLFYEDAKNKNLGRLLERLEKKLTTINQEEYKSQKEYKADGIMHALNAKQLVFKDEKYNQIHQLLWLLLLVIELLPIILKLLFKRTSYDAQIQRISDEASMEQDTFVREAKLKHQMEFKALHLKEHSHFKEMQKMSKTEKKS